MEDKMSEVDMYEVVKKLIGPINPVGVSEDDEIRFDNLKRMTVLVDMLLTDIDAIVVDHKDSHMGSCQNAANFAAGFYDHLGIVE
jgi:hypothetical protein